VHCIGVYHLVRRTPLSVGTRLRMYLLVNIPHRPAQPVAREQHVTRDTMLGCPRRHAQWEKTF